MKKFPLMGKIVTVSAIYKRHHTLCGDPKEFVVRKKAKQNTLLIDIKSKILQGYLEIREWKKTPITHRAGWVTGYRYLQNGIYHPGDRYEYGEDYDYLETGPYLKIQSMIPCYLVAFYPTHNSVRVPIDCVIQGGIPKVDMGWDDRAKNSQREIMANWPRDKKGRWKRYADVRNTL